MTDPQRWGVQPGYYDVAGHWWEAPPATIDAFLEAMGAHDGAPSPGPAIIVAPGRPRPQLPPGELWFEDGTSARVEGDLPNDLPFGYHRFMADTGAAAGAPMIVSPGRCWLPERLNEWGWAAQLYATRSTASWGMGDLADLRRLGQWSAAQGAGVALINPLHAGLPVGAQQPSPYFASSRCFRNPLYLRIEEVPGAEHLAGLTELAAAGQALNSDRRIDRDAVWQLKSAALEMIFAAQDAGPPRPPGAGGQTPAAPADEPPAPTRPPAGPEAPPQGTDPPGGPPVGGQQDDRTPSAGPAGGQDPAFDRYLKEQGRALHQYATFCALSEWHGLPWADWPAEVRHPDGDGIARFEASEAGARRIRYHSWLQWLLDRQLQAAGETIGLVQDLAIGADAGGADAWRWQDCTALEVRVGAPPDEFNVAGQNWALPPFDPWKLRAAGYQPFIELVRAGLRDAGGMRFDHVMGLFRLFWIPADGSPTDGTYVHYPAGDLLDILALESHRARAFVVGEDLGTVEEEVRVELEARRVLSYRLLYFEPTPPARGEWPSGAMAAATTHDLPTVAGLWTGSDAQARRDLGLTINEEAEAGLRAKVKDWTGADDDLAPAEVVDRVYGLLGDAPCVLVTATLDDALAVEERPNVPGTVDEWPNWRIALPSPLEDIEHAPLAQSIAASLNRRHHHPM